MLILSIRTPKRVHATGENYERVVLQFPDGSEGVIHFFHTSGNHLKCGFEFPETVRVCRGSVLDHVEPEKLAAFTEGLSKLAEACKAEGEGLKLAADRVRVPVTIDGSRLLPEFRQELTGRPLSKYFPLTAAELNAAEAGGPST